jgi:aspartate racemase
MPVTMKNINKARIGIVGGLGPLASAEFLKTIYEYNIGEREQDSPIVIYSDPTVPDRTEGLLNQDEGVLLESLTRTLKELIDLGVSKVIICCITIHHLLPRLPVEYRERVISLIDVIFKALSHARKRHLLICTTGTRKLEIFESHPLWRELSAYVVLPDESDQEIIHRDLIYRAKKNADPRELVSMLESLLRKYDVDSFIAGCTEIHLLTKQIFAPGSNPNYRCIDPLLVLATELRQEVA